MKITAVLTVNSINLVIIYPTLTLFLNSRWNDHAAKRPQESDSQLRALESWSSSLIVTAGRVAFPLTYVMLRQTFKVFLCLVGCVVRWWVHGIKTPCFPWPGSQSVNSTIEGGRVFQQQGARIKIPDEPDWVWSWESTRCVVSWLLPAGVLTHRPSGARRRSSGHRSPVVSAVLPWTRSGGFSRTTVDDDGLRPASPFLTERQAYL